MTMTLTRSTREAEKADKAENAMDLRTAYLLCQRSVLGHAWEFYAGDPRYPDNPGRDGLRYSNFVCPRCTTKRHWAFAGSARVGYPVYEYPDDYGLGGDVSSEELWAEVFVREADGRLVIKAKRIRTTRVEVPV